jgi:hypothetical protein
VEALRARRERQQHERTLIGEGAWRAHGLVFNAENGAPLHRNTITKQFHAHVADIYLHSLDVQVRDTAQSVERALAPAYPTIGTCPTCGRQLLASSL